MKTNYILVSPEMARYWLEKNVRNRPISNKHLDSYATEMKSGKWIQETGESIKITKSGHIADGQHRLLALIKANISLHFTVVTEMEEDVISVLDSGKRRNGSDILSIYGVKNAAVVSALISTSNVLKRGIYSNYGSSNVESRMTNHDILEKYLEKSEYWNIVGTKSLQWYEGFSRILKPTSLGSFYVIFQEIDEEKANQFLDQLSYGIPVYSNAINILRNKLIQEVTSHKKMTPFFRNSLIIKAWNSFRLGKDIKILSYDPEKEGKIRPI
jgi:hypothetical protein